MTFENVSIEVPFKEDYITVDVEAYYTMENDGIGSYECWGFKGFDRGEDYVYVQNAKWDESLYTAEQNDAIRKYVDDSYSELETHIEKYINF